MEDRRRPRRPLPLLRPISAASAGNAQPIALTDNTPPGLSTETEIMVNGQRVQVMINDLQKNYTLGEGQYGFVDCMTHTRSNCVFAVKKIRCSMDSREQRRTLNDLNIGMRSSNCPYVVLFYGALFQDGDVWICMELMDISLDKLYMRAREVGTHIPEELIAYIAYCVTNALEYLRAELKIMHRDIKPSNIVADKGGRVKVCDFGISGELINSVTTSNVGSQPYLAPERIKSDGVKGYRIQSDVWSLGITLLELAARAFPYRRWTGLFDQLQVVVDNPSPRLTDIPGSFSENAVDFIDFCLIKSSTERPDFRRLLVHPFLMNLDLEDCKAMFGQFVCAMLDGGQEDDSEIDGDNDIEIG